jgi:hypothetical protein
MRNVDVWETLVVEVESVIRSALPAAWSLQIRPTDEDDRVVDGIVELIGPNQQRIAFALEVKRSGPVSSTGLVDQLITLTTRTPEPLLFVTDYRGYSSDRTSMAL